MYELEDDMDELFRRAAKDYPLDTNTADWNKLHEAMQRTTSGSEGNVMSVGSKKGKRKLLWLLLLLPLPWVCYKYSNDRDNTKAETAQVNNTGKAVAITNPDDKTENSNNSPMTDKQETQSVSAPAQTSRIVPESYLANNSQLSKKGARNWSPAPANQNESKQVKTEDNNAVQTPNTESLPPSESIVPAIKEEKKNTDSAVAEKTKVEKEEEKQQKNKKDKKSDKNNNKIKGFYIGIAGGPDLSSVKLQAIKNVGFNGGLLVGYQWNKRFSVESNVVLNKKYYYSEGQYFSTEKIYLPPNTKIGKVAGDCKMIEWAVNVRYNLKSKGATTWSAMAGLSSYFMKTEDYNYEYVYSNGQTADRYRTYSNASNHWLSVINLGLTYNHSLGRTGSLRIEPYLKLPVKGLGIGSLPIMSTGLNVGFIKKIF